MKPRILLTAAVLAAAALLAPSAFSQDELNRGGFHADGRGNRLRNTSPRHAATGGANTTGNGINYNGGPVILGTTHVYFIWYGTWDANSQTIMTEWGNSIGGSPYFNINTGYFDGNNNNVTNAVTLNASTSDNYSQGKSLSDSSVWAIVNKAIAGGALPVDTNGVYFVLTASDVSETSGFLTQYCGWHTYNYYSNSPIKYAFVGNASANLGACAAQTAKSPNANPAADAMISVMSHELEESVTDPLLNAWYDSNGEENADKCAWTFGSTYTTSNGSAANMNLGGHDFLIQQNWVNASGGYCALSYNATPDFSLSVSPASQSVARGGSTGNYGVSVNPSNGFTDGVTLTVAGLPAGATASSFVPNPATASSAFSISTTTSTAAGSYPLTITGTDAAKSLTHTVSATLVVTAPDFSLSVSPSSQAATQGGSTPAYNLTLHPVNGFSGSATMSVSGLPAGASALFTPGSITSTGTMVITTASTTPAGSYNLTIKGVSGTLSHTVAATLVVNPVGGFTVSVAPTPQTATRGTSVSYTVTVTPGGGFSGNVSLSVSGLPSHSSSALSVNPVGAGSWSSVLKVTVARNASRGSYPFTVTGTSGATTAKGSASLMVN